MLAFKQCRGKVHPKTFEVFFLSTNPIFENIQINTQLQNSTKKLSEVFSNKYENKLDNIWETTEKESSHLDLYFKTYSQSKYSQILFLK